MNEIEKTFWELCELTRDSKFYASTESKAQTTEAIQTFFGMATDNQKAILTGYLAQALGWEQGRAAALLALHSKMDIRRALEWQPRRPRRGQDEKLFPTEGWIGAYLLYAQENEAPLVWHFWSAVTLLGAACQRHVYLDRGAYTIWPNYYTVLIGPSGSGKSTAINMATDIIQRANHQLEKDDDWPADRRIRVLPETVTGIQFLNKLKSGKVADTVKGQILGDRWSASIGYLANDELTTLLGKGNVQSSKLIQILTAIYQCPDHWTDDAYLRGGFELRDVAVSLLLGSATEWIRDEVSDAMMKGGFMNRCHFCYRPDHKQIYSKPGANDPIIADALASMLVELIKSPFAAMTLSPEAEEWYESWYEGFKTLPPPIDILFGNSHTRKPSHILKLGIILALSRDIRTRVIHQTDLVLALKLLEEESKYHPAMFEGFNSSKESRREDFVFDVLKRSTTWVPRREIHRLCYRMVKGSMHVDQILKTLKRKGMIEKIIGKNKQPYFRVARASAREALRARGASLAAEDSSNDITGVDK